MPSLKERKKVKRLAAFRDVTAAESVNKLYPVEIEGKGRVLVDVPIDQPASVTDIPVVKKRGNLRHRKGTNTDPPAKDDAEIERVEFDQPNWPDSEFPWRLRLEERAQVARAEEADRLKWIERFLDRDSDEDCDEGDDDDERVPLINGWDQSCHNQTTSRKGRGKMVPLMTYPSDSLTSPLHQGSICIPSDPADARTALMSKKSARSLPYRKERRAKWKSEDHDNHDEGDSETVCICNRRDDGQELVQCDSCQTWYHLQCIGIRNVAELGREEDPWYCNRCPLALTGTSSPVRPHEPAFAQMEDEQKPNHSIDLPFFQPPMQDSLMTAWTSQRPTTPTRGSRFLDGFSSGSSWNDFEHSPSTPLHPSHSVRVYSTPGPFDTFGDEDTFFDPTSTPSRGIKFDPSFATPKNNIWYFRSSGLFQTPSKQGRGMAGRMLGPSLLSSESDDSSLGVCRAYRNSQSLDESPIRRTKPGDGSKSNISRRVPQSPMTCRTSTVSSHPSLSVPPALGWNESQRSQGAYLLPDHSFPPAPTKSDTGSPSTL